MSDRETTYCGVVLTKLTREELIGAVEILGAMVQDQAKESQRKTDFYSEMLKARS